MRAFLLVSLSCVLLIFILSHSPSIAHADTGGCSDVHGSKCGNVNTAIGPIIPDAQKLVARIFSLILGLAGGIALILIILSGYRFMTSGGSPEAFQAARDTLVSAIVGILFIIFSFVILQIIGVDILRIPGFNP
ncbi:MAG: hypothetical protein AAB583_01765 [Patescibacteria group bacterium]